MITAPHPDPRLGATKPGSGRLVIAALALLVAVSAVFVAFPRIDLTVASWFRWSSPSPYWLWYLDWRPKAIRTAARAIEVAAAAVVLAPFALKLAFPRFQPPFSPRQALFLAASFLIGVVVIVDAILKSFWGRARPRYTADFHPEAIGLDSGAFSRAWALSDSCTGNCSFVSSEAAAAAWLFAFAFVVPRRWRGGVALFALGVFALVAFARVSVGGHYLSDVLIAGAIEGLVIAVLAVLILDRLPSSFDARVEALLSRVALRRRRRPGLAKRAADGYRPATGGTGAKGNGEG